MEQRKSGHRDMLSRLPGKATAERVKHHILRVDHAGETGAVAIYTGQGAILKNSVMHQASYAVIIDMKRGEEKHLTYFETLLPQYRVRPSFLSPFWKMGGYMMGVVTTFLSKNHAMVCTEAVETVIGRHYQDQMDYCQKNPALLSQDEVKTLKQFRDEELEHLDGAVADGAHQASFYALTDKIIQAVCRMSIAIARRV